MRSSTRTHLLALLLLTASWLTGCGEVVLPRPPDTATPSPTAAPAEPTATANPTSLPVVASTPDAPVGPFPPQLVAVEPAPGESVLAEATDGVEIGLRWTFDQAIVPESFAEALRIAPEIVGELVWESDRVVTLAPLQAGNPLLTPGTRYSVAIDAALLTSVNGLHPGQDVVYSFAAMAPLQVTAVYPEDDAVDARGDAPIVVSFNYPVVPETCLGVTTEEGSACPPPPLVVSPSSMGQGFWLDAATYVYETPSGWVAGTGHSAKIEAGLVSLSGAPMATPYLWTFETAVPKVVTLSPAPGEQDVGLDTVISVGFSTPMDADVTGQALSMVAEDGTPVAGAVTWVDGGGKLVFTPLDLLDTDTAYRVRIGERARAVRSTPLVDPPVWDFRTVAPAEVAWFAPQDGETGVALDAPVQIAFTGALSKSAVRAGVTVTSPEGTVTTFQTYDPAAGVATLMWERQPRTEYCVDVSAIPDLHGRTVVTPARVCFATGDRPAELGLALPVEVVTLEAGRPSVVGLRARNVDEVDFVLTEVDAPAIAGAVTGGEVIREWKEAFDIPLETAADVPVTLRRLGGALPTGLYQLAWTLPGNAGTDSVSIAVVDQHVMLKLSHDEAVVWVADMSTGAPVVRTEVQLLDADGLLIAGGTTDDNGLASLPRPGGGLDGAVAAVTGQIGDEGFGFAMATSQAMGLPAAFGITSALDSRALYWAHMHTDRAGYDPGDRVQIAGYVREHVEGVYRPPRAGEQISLTVTGPGGSVIDLQALALTATGRFDATVALARGLPAGVYAVEAWATDDGAALPPLARVEIGVAPATNPGVVVDVTPQQTDVADGMDAAVEIRTHDLRGGPLAEVAVRWQVSAAPTRFAPDTGDAFESPASAASQNGSPSHNGWRWHMTDSGATTRVVAEGTAITDASGRAVVTVPASLVPGGLTGGRGPELWRVEAEVAADRADATSDVTPQDAGWFLVHPADLYLGLRPVSWVVREKERLAIDLVAADWLGEGVGGQSVRLELDRRTWGPDAAGGWVYTDTLVSDQMVTTSGSGTTAAAFTAPRSGSFVVKAIAADAEGREARTEVCLWVGGPDDGDWPVGRTALILVPDQSTYEVGETARVFVPTPFAGPFELLLTVERDSILDVRRIAVEDANPILDVPVLASYAPNVTLSVAVLRPGDEARVTEVYAGYTTLTVTSPRQRLSVETSVTGNVFAPGDEVDVQIRTLDATGAPVSADITVAVRDVDGARGICPKLRGADDLYEAFYGRRPLRVLTGDGLLPLWLSRSTVDSASAINSSAYGSIAAQCGLAGGPAASLPSLDGLVAGSDQGPAIWTAGVRTDDAGEATITVVLPEDPALWKLSVWATTENAGAGTADLDLNTRRPLAVQPLAPASLVPGDQVELAALVHNRSGTPRVVDVEIVDTVNLAVESAQGYRVELAGGETRRLVWQVRVPDKVTPAGSVGPSRAMAEFFAQSAGLIAEAEMTDPVTGEPGVPIELPQGLDTWAVSRVFAGSRLVEMVSVPDGVGPGARLVVRIDASLGAMLAESLAEGAHGLSLGLPDTVSAWASEFVRALAAFRALAPLSESVPGVDGARSALEATIEDLYGWQNEDGGWGWAPGESDPAVSADVALGLLRAREAGLIVRDDRLAHGLAYVAAALDAAAARGKRAPSMAQGLQVLSEAGQAWPGGVGAMLYAARNDLGLAGRAHLAAALGLVDASDTRVTTLLDELRAAAIVEAPAGQESGDEETVDASANGDGAAGVAQAVALGHDVMSVTHWEEHNRQAGVTPVRLTALVADVLIRLDPAAPEIPGAITWLLERRQGNGWGTPGESMWATTALADYVAVNGDVGSDSAVVVKLNDAVVPVADISTSDAGGGTSRTFSLGVGPHSSGAAEEAAVAPMLGKGLNTLEFLRGEGGGVIFTSLVLEMPPAMDSVTPESRGITLNRSYCAVSEVSADPRVSAETSVLADAGVGEALGRVATTACVPVSQVALGEKVEVRLLVTVPDALYGVRLEDPLPAGFEVSPGGCAAEVTGAFRRTVPDYGLGALRTKAQRAEVFVAPELTPGVHEVAYRIVAVRPGTTTALPATAWEIAFPYVVGRTGVATLAVTGVSD